MQRTVLLAVVIPLIALGSFSACATKGRVATQMDTLRDEFDEKVGAVSQSLEETRGRVDRNTVRIGEVDQTARTALDSAESADELAQAADAAAAGAHDRIDAIEAGTRKLLFEVVLAANQDQFEFGKASLPEAAMATLDELVGRLKNHPTPVYLEIEGHTDATGPKELNDRLGLARAESAMRYLHERHGVPLHKINIISYGEGKPIAPNETREGRAQNRRVVVMVLG